MVSKTNFKNEIGNTLLIVLLLIIVFSILGLSLVSINAARLSQVAKSKEGVLAVNMAEIGMKNVKKEMEIVLKNDPYPHSTVYEIERHINDSIKGVINQQIEPNYSFTYKLDSTSISSADELSSSLLSTGKYLDKTREIYTEFNITKTFPSSPYKTTTYNNGKGNDKKLEEWVGQHINRDLHFKPNGTKNVHVDGHLYIDGNLTLNSNTNLTVDGDFYITKQLTQEANSDLIVNGDAYVKKAIVKENDGNQGNLGFFCVTGELFDYENTNDIILLNGETCDSLAQRSPPANGIYAKSAPPLWRIDTIKTEYK